MRRGAIEEQSLRPSREACPALDHLLHVQEMKQAIRHLSYKFG